MESNDINLLIKVLDKAITSDSETVKQLLQSLLVTVSLVHADNPNNKGPLAEMLDDLAYYEERISALEYSMQNMNQIMERNEREHRYKRSIDDEYGYKRDHNYPSWPNLYRNDHYDTINTYLKGKWNEKD